MKTQYRFVGATTKRHGDLAYRLPGPWRETMSAAILDALDAGQTGKDQIEMRSVQEPNYAASFGGDEE